MGLVALSELPTAGLPHKPHSLTWPRERHREGQDVPDIEAATVSIRGARVVTQDSELVRRRCRGEGGNNEQLRNPHLRLWLAGPMQALCIRDREIVGIWESLTVTYATPPAGHRFEIIHVSTAPRRLLLALIVGQRLHTGWMQGWRARPRSTANLVHVLPPQLTSPATHLHRLRLRCHPWLSAM
jgi:hypothetical protein